MSDRGGEASRTPAAWVIITAGSIATVMSAPGQTAAISVFTDPLIDELGISRNALSTSYLIGTLVGAGAMPLIGRALDRFGIGRVMATVGLVFGAVLIALSTVTGLVGLTAGFIGVRMAGQGALGLAATTAVAVHITRHRGLALGITSAVGSAGIALAPVLLERLISRHDMATTWLIEGVAVWVIVLPIALGIFRHRPPRRAPGPERAEVASDPPATGTGTAQWTTGQALRTPLFWVIASAVAASGMLTTGLNFHQIAALGEQGLTPAQAALNFVPQAAATMTITIGVGALIDRVAPTVGLVVAMAILAGALLTLNSVTTPWTAVAYGCLLGASGGALRPVEAATLTRTFGVAHIGSIRGIITMISVASTAFGPLALSVGQQLIGSYGLAARLLAVIPVAVGVWALLVRAPRSP